MKIMLGRGETTWCREIASGYAYNHLMELPVNERDGAEIATTVSGCASKLNKNQIRMLESWFGCKIVETVPGSYNLTFTYSQGKFGDCYHLWKCCYSLVLLIVRQGELYNWTGKKTLLKAILDVDVPQLNSEGKFLTATFLYGVLQALKEDDTGKYLRTFYKETSIYVNGPAVYSDHYMRNYQTDFVYEYWDIVNNIGDAILAEGDRLRSLDRSSRPIKYLSYCYLLFLARKHFSN